MGLVSMPFKFKYFKKLVLLFIKSLFINIGKPNQLGFKLFIQKEIILVKLKLTFFGAYF